jgi:ABC-2 type transport system permease protein
MNPLLLSEYRKLSTLRLPWLVLVAAPIFAALIATAGVRLLTGSETLVAAEAARAVTEPLWFLVTVVAILASAGEFQHRTIRTTLLATPRRASVLGAKAVVIAGYGALVTALGAGVAAVTGVAIAHIEGVPVDGGRFVDWGGVAGAVLVGALFGTLASALGMLTRSTALALTTLLLWRFVGEGILPVVSRRPEISAWTPSGVARTVVEPWGDVLRTVGSASILLGYVVLVAAAAAVVFLRRDPA